MNKSKKQDGRESPLSALLPVVGDAAKGVGNSITKTITGAFERDKGKGPIKKKGRAPIFGAKPTKGGRKRRKTRRKRRKSRRKRRKSRRKRRKSRRKKKR